MKKMGMKKPSLGGGGGKMMAPPPPPPMPQQAMAGALGGAGGAMDHQTSAMGFAGGGAVCYDKHCATEGKK